MGVIPSNGVCARMHAVACRSLRPVTSPTHLRTAVRRLQQRYEAKHHSSINRSLRAPGMGEQTL